MESFEEEKEFWLRFPHNESVLKKGLENNPGAFEHGLRMYFTYKHIIKTPKGFQFEYEKTKIAVTYSLDDVSAYGIDTLSSIISTIQSESEFKQSFATWRRGKKINDLLDE